MTTESSIYWTLQNSNTSLTSNYKCMKNKHQLKSSLLATWPQLWPSAFGLILSQGSDAVVSLLANESTAFVLIKGLQEYHMVRSWRCGCLATWFCYQLIAKPGNKTAAPPYFPTHIFQVIKGPSSLQSSLSSQWRADDGHSSFIEAMILAGALPGRLKVHGAQQLGASGVQVDRQCDTALWLLDAVPPGGVEESYSVHRKSYV